MGCFGQFEGKCRCIIHFSIRATMWLWKLKTAHTTKDEQNLATLQFGFVYIEIWIFNTQFAIYFSYVVRITLTQLTKWVFSGKIYIVGNKSIIHVLFLYILELSLQACKTFAVCCWFFVLKHFSFFSLYHGLLFFCCLKPFSILFFSVIWNSSVQRVERLIQCSLKF